MPLYFLMSSTTERGQRLLQNNPDLIVDSIRECASDGAEILSQYAVLGRYDFVLLAEADDNDAAASLSLELSVRVGLHIETLPAIALRLRADRDGDAENVEPAYAETPSGDPTNEWTLPNQNPD